MTKPNETNYFLFSLTSNKQLRVRMLSQQLSSLPLLYKLLEWLTHYLSFSLRKPVQKLPKKSVRKVKRVGAIVQAISGGNTQMCVNSM